eukprot:CAMPEP_0201567316 /NCGR_PEP_ID=MMETSP0190_2-20130828/7773_1 /ASSEMBLY_ACC=CAM_ASM_000263 /TAXON_ID=37353 /ORGANISM="Rosalina sp." /LENGTH=320 /DNA_ID=CAMNT_0047987167 /DNA_START=133 /DNA_END=1092 /DNA_ORIENTATION=-
MIRICLASLLIYGLSADCSDGDVCSAASPAPGSESDCCFLAAEGGPCIEGMGEECASTPPDDSTVSSTTTTEEPCDDSDLSAWTVDYIGKSTQFRIYEPCDGKFIKFKMEDLTEFNGETNKKTNNKETSFASSKDWLWGDGTYQGVDATYKGNDAILNIFHADELTDGETTFNLTTWFFKNPTEIPDPNDANNTITVLANTLKFDTTIENWSYLADDNYLVLCIGIMTNKAGDIDDDPDTKTFWLQGFEIDNAQTASCIDENGDSTDINVGIERDGNGNNHLDLCYTFDHCDGTIKYDPTIQFDPSSTSSATRNIFVAIW